MPLSAVRAEVASRFAEARALLTEISAREADEGTSVSAGLNTQKAMFIVLLYAAFEFTTTLLVVRTAEGISGQRIAHSDLAVELLSLALDPQLRAVASPGRRAKWQRRSALFSRTFSTDTARIHEEALLEELGNIWCASLDQVFEAFGISGPSLHDPRARQYIDEITDRRNAVAHGREAATTVGSRYTAASLQLRLQELERQKDYLIGRFEPLLRDRLYLRASGNAA